MQNVSATERRFFDPAFDSRVKDEAQYFEESFTPEEAERVWKLAFALIAGGHEAALMTALPRAAVEVAEMARLFYGGGVPFKRKDGSAGHRGRSDEPLLCVVTWEGGTMAIKLTQGGFALLAEKVQASE